MIGLILYVSAALMDQASVRPAIETADMAEACNASLAVIRSIAATPGKVIFHGWDAEGSPENDGEPHWSPERYATDHHLSAPSRESTERLYQSSNLRRSAVTSCPTIRAFLAEHHLRFGSEETMKAITAHEDDVVIASVSLAAVDGTGQDAIVTTGSAGTAGGGGGWVRSLVRDQATGWHEAYIAPTWIS